MKYVLLYLAVLLIGVNADLMTLRLQEIIEDCKNISGVKQVLIDQAHKGNFTNDENLKYYYSCVGDRYRHAGYLQAMPKKRTYIGNVLVHLSNWNLSIHSLRDWLVNRLQHSARTVNGTLPTCVPYDWRFTINLLVNEVFEVSRCLSEKGVPVDVVSTNYVDRSDDDFNELHEICKHDHDIDQKLINEAQNGNVSDSESLASYYICYSLNAGFLDAYGNISYNFLKNWFKQMLKQNSDKVDSAFHTCYTSYVEEIHEMLPIVKCFADEKLPLDVRANQ